MCVLEIQLGDFLDFVLLFEITTRWVADTLEPREVL